MFHIYVTLNSLSVNPTKWLNTLKQFVGKLPTNCLSVFDHFVKLALKGLKEPFFCLFCFCLHLCCSSSINGNFKVEKKYSIQHVSAFIDSLSISIQQLFFSSRKMTTGIFSHPLWCHSPQTEQNATKNPLSFFGSSLKNNTRYLHYNGKRCVTSFPCINRFV